MASGDRTFHDVASGQSNNGRIANLPYPGLE